MPPNSAPRATRPSSACPSPGTTQAAATTSASLTLPRGDSVATSRPRAFCSAIDRRLLLGHDREPELSHDLGVQAHADLVLAQRLDRLAQIELAPVDLD